MAITAGWIVDRVARALHDTDHTRWPLAEKLLFLNMAQLQTVMVQPEANAKYKQLTLTASARQSLPDTDLRLMTVIRNMGANGLTPGRHISLTDRATMDAQLAAWTAGQTVTEIESYVYDPRVQTEFFVYPPPNTADLHIEYVASERPVDCVATTDFISLADTYISPVMHWMLYQALVFQLDSPSSASQAMSHYQLFNNELGADVKAGDLYSPNPRENYLPGARS